MAFSIKDISQLGPAAQKQIMEKLKADAREQAAIKKGKYHNEPTERVMGDGSVHKFPSKKEAARYDELMALYKAGKISDLRLQPQFTLQESYITAEGKRIRAIRYDADFSYINVATGEYVVEDAKGIQTPVYKMKKKLMADKFGIEVKEV